jgi:hypothetical protein
MYPYSKVGEIALFQHIRENNLIIYISLNMKITIILVLIAISISTSEINQILNNLNVQLGDNIYNHDKTKGLKFVETQNCHNDKGYKTLSCVFTMKAMDKKSCSHG